jgi:hypothetical protein
MLSAAAKQRLSFDRCPRDAPLREPGFKMRLTYSPGAWLPMALTLRPCPSAIQPTAEFSAALFCTLPVYLV